MILAGFVYEFGFHTVDELRNSVMVSLASETHLVRYFIKFLGFFGKMFLENFTIGFRKLTLSKSYSRITGMLVKL